MAIGKCAVLGVGGGIAGYKVAFLASRLVQSGVTVRVAMTPSALQFVGAVTFAGLTGSQPILSSTQVDRDGSVPHIDAAKNADVYCIAPATAGVLTQLASGAADDPVAARLASAGRSYIGHYGSELLHDCVQLHGGIGVTFEHDLHLHLRRHTLDRGLFGTAGDHRRTVAGRREAAA